MNHLTSFQFENDVAHGAIVEISTGAAEMLGQRAYSSDVRRLIGEAMAAMPLLATHVRFEGRVNLQFQSDAGAGTEGIRLLVAQVDHHLQVRGMAKAAATAQGGFPDLMKSGVLALMLEPRSDTVPATQAAVPIEGGSLAEALEGYFAQSEQLPTLIRLAASEERICGFMLQRLPQEHTRATQDDWEHLEMLAETLTESELLSVDAPTILRRLFANEALRLFEPRPVSVACRCSRDGISRLLLSLGATEVESIIAEQGKVEVTCEFCGRQYAFSGSEATELFVAADQPPGGTIH